MRLPPPPLSPVSLPNPLAIPSPLHVRPLRPSKMISPKCRRRGSLVASPRCKTSSLSLRTTPLSLMTKASESSRRARERHSKSRMGNPLPAGLSLADGPYAVWGDLRPNGTRVRATKTRGTKTRKPSTLTLLGNNNVERSARRSCQCQNSPASCASQSIFRLSQEMLILAKVSIDMSFSSNPLPASNNPLPAPPADTPAVAATAPAPSPSISNEPTEAWATSAFFSRLRAIIAPRVSGVLARKLSTKRSSLGPCQASARQAMKASVKQNEMTLQRNSHKSDKR